MKSIDLLTLWLDLYYRKHLKNYQKLKSVDNWF